MMKLFGTDGIRGVANLTLTPELAFGVGKITGFILSNNQKCKVLIGKDTRTSGDLLENAIASGLMSMGLDVYMAGVLPTPAIAYLTKHDDYIAGIVISASHNSFEYNGIKIFSNDGFKLPDEMENKIEELINSDTKIYKSPVGEKIGRQYYIHDSKQKYIDYLVGLSNLNLKNKKIALDLGNGASYDIAKKVFEKLGAEVIAINDNPNGININDNCGSTNPKLIQKLTIESKADIGMSFDGDADRIIAVDELGDIVDGDHILAICATYLKSIGKLKNNTIVGTVMSNIGLKKYLKSIGVNLEISKVGDRYVLEDMLKNGSVLGGEQSGHIIFLNNNTTGDGLATGIHLLEVMINMDKKLSELNNLMKSYPQVLINARVRYDLKNKYLEFDDIKEKIQEIEKEFNDNGRVLIRPSGTENLIRVMIEGEDEDKLTKKAQELADYIEEKLG